MSRETRRHYQAELKAKGRESFLHAYPYPFLVFREHLETVGGWEDFVTGPIHLGGLKTTSREEPSEPVDDDPTEPSVRRIAKAPGNPWLSRISVGRAGNNDLVVPSGSVSKLHAHFTIAEGSVVQLTDTGSQNGTKVNGSVLKSGVATALRAGDEISFGDVRAVFHTADTFADYLGGPF